jgi:hypothetical protein
MKLIDTLSEDEEKKLIKKAKLIFSILKKGTITRRDGVSFSYELKDNMVPRIVKGEVEISAFITEIIERTYCPINEHAMKDLIMDKFNHFNINANLYYTSNSHVEKYKGKKPWEEQRELNESKEDNEKLIKKVKTIYKAISGSIIRKGHFGNITYELPREYDIQIDVNDDPFVKVGRNGTDNEIKFYYVDGTSGEVKQYRLNNHEYHLFVREIERRKFKPFNIVLWYEPNENVIQPINEALMRYTEDDLTDKDRKKVKLIYDLFKTGRYIDDDTKYEYVLPDEYYVSIDDETGMPVVVLTMNPSQTLDLYMVLTNTYIPKVDKEYNNLYKDTKRRIKEKFNNFNIDIIF